MKTATLFLVVSAALARAQITIEDGIIKCAKPFQAYCVGSSLKTDIIARCDAAGVGHRGRCGNNLAGMPPIGNSVALCYQSSDASGDAACEKNCVVYGGSGNGNGTFTLPAAVCVPTFTETSTGFETSTSSTEGPTETSIGEGTTTSSTCTSDHTTVPSVPSVPSPPPEVPTVLPAPESTTSIPAGVPSEAPTWAPFPPTTTTSLPTVPTAAAPVLSGQMGVTVAAFAMAVACLL